MPLMNMSFEPGRCVETIEKMSDGPKKDIALAEYYYFSGRAEKAIQATAAYLTAPDTAARLCAWWIYAYACLSMDRIDHAPFAYVDVKVADAIDDPDKEYGRIRPQPERSYPGLRQHEL